MRAKRGGGSFVHFYFLRTPIDEQTNDSNLCLFLRFMGFTRFGRAQKTGGVFHLEIFFLHTTES